MAFHFDRIHVLGALFTTASLLAACTAGEDNGITFEDEASETEGNGSADETGNGDGNGDGDGGDRGGDDGSDDGGEQHVPHARGTIVLGESHAPKASTSAPIVTASFVPDHHAQPAACGEQIAGCFVQTLPDCGGECGYDEFCAFDAGCEAKCERYCDLACAADEVCYFPIPENPACKKIEYFDAGALTFTGTTVPVTLFPPYHFQGNVTGALYLPDSELTVHASGTNNAGFEAFEQSFRTTSYLRTQIDSIGLPDLYGSGPLPITWTAGADDIRIQLTVSGLGASYGVVTCDADDTSGSFGVPREAIVSVLADDEELGGIHVSIERRRSELHKGMTTTGQLLDQTVQPEGWLELVSTSVETTTLTGCGGSAYCGGECVDVYWNDAHCGSCNNACSAIETCYSGTCESNCAWNEIACGNACVNPNTNTSHCGACNNSCGAGQSCVSGVCTGGDDGGGGVPGACCSSKATPGCSDPSVESCVCAADSYCCTTAWDNACVNQVTSLGCGTC